MPIRRGRRNRPRDRAVTLDAPSRVFSYGIRPELAPESSGRRTSGGLFDRDFVREQEGGCAVGKLHQEHRAVQIANLAQDGRLFAKPGPSFMVTNRSQESAMPACYFPHFALAHHISTSFGPLLAWPLNSTSSVATSSKQRA